MGNGISISFFFPVSGQTFFLAFRPLTRRSNRKPAPSYVHFSLNPGSYRSEWTVRSRIIRARQAGKT
ncbi:MAG: hypothetical protein OP8BY_1568 [Candidatus Saccharicenans subterraneus]|uniref:Uncharacterized protein n=1 Tax=Candidatus Saccharicenans subterraneus TaxID=2508984 RepID=A0A3E2BNQ1_9BACT|nr:MAG: hypothetical protein OP8BY_1568 [Candidatus Saccharicenans subterraneum]